MHALSEHRSLLLQALPLRHAPILARRCDYQAGTSVTFCPATALASDPDA